ncbi:serine/threonine-protein kinase Wnk-like isoform X1 [Aedes albopictus]|uniref:PHD-type domain-containing protein n=1 Tax=Aedes albopictus TaxID=7160 RepID=A0ABM1XR50_AEDAL
MSHHPATSNKYGCGGCDRPDEADNLVQCDVCDAWWHFSCAGVTGSITDRSWMCTRCKRTSRASSRASVTSRSSSQLAESMARLRERQELQKRRTEVELEKKFLEEQRELLEASIAAEVERRSQVSRTDSRRRVQDWIESSADQTTSAAEGNRQPAASVVQQHDTHPRQGNSDAAAAADNLDIQLHSSPLRDRTIPAFEATGDFSDLQPLPEVISQHNAKDLIRELRVRLERCLLQSEPTSPQLADLQQQLQLCREEIEGMHSTVYRLTTVSMPAAQTDNIGTVGSNDELVQPVAKPLGAIPKHRPNEFLQGKCHASENQIEINNISQPKSHPIMQIPPQEQQRIAHARSSAINNEQPTVTQHTPFPPAITQVPHLRQYAFGYQPPVQQELVLPPPVQQPTVQQSAMQQPPVQQHAESQHPVQQPPVQEPLLQSRTGQQSAMQEPPVQQYIEQQPPVQQPPLVQLFSVQQSMMQQPLVQQIVDRQNPVHQHSVQQPSMQRHVEHQHPAQQPPVQQPSAQQPSVQQPSMQKPSVQQPSVQQPSVQRPSVQQPSAQEYFVHPRMQQCQVRHSQVQQPSVQQSSTQHPSEQQHVERHHPVPRPSVPQIQRPMQLSSAQQPSEQLPPMQ